MRGFNFKVNGFNERNTANINNLKINRISSDKSIFTLMYVKISSSLSHFLNFLT